MKDDCRSLTLTIEARNPNDFNVLLRQARYEIEKLLPPPEGASDDERTKRNANRWVFGSYTEESQITEGHSSGTLGSYRFKMIKGSSEYANIERDLLAQGFERHRTMGVFRTDGLEFYYTHDQHGTKVIDGEPLTVRDHTTEEDL